MSEVTTLPALTDPVLKKKIGRPRKRPIESVAVAVQEAVPHESPKSEPAPAKAFDEIVPGSVGAIQERLNSEKVPEAANPFWWLLRQR